MGAPLYLSGAIHVVERVLRDAYPEALTPAQIAEQLVEQGFRWPLPRRPGRGGNPVPRTAEPTAERVRRICQMGGNSTRIMPTVESGHKAYTIWKGA